MIDLRESRQPLHLISFVSKKKKQLTTNVQDLLSFLKHASCVSDIIAQDVLQIIIEQ